MVEHKTFLKKLTKKQSSFSLVETILSSGFWLVLLVCAFSLLFCAWPWVLTVRMNVFSLSCWLFIVIEQMIVSMKLSNVLRAALQPFETRLPARTSTDVCRHAYLWIYFWICVPAFCIIKEIMKSWRVLTFLTICKFKVQKLQIWDVENDRICQGGCCYHILQMMSKLIKPGDHLELRQMVLRVKSIKHFASDKGKGHHHRMSFSGAREN